MPKQPRDKTPPRETAPTEEEGLPKWIHDLAAGDYGLDEVLTEAWVAGMRARRAVQECGDEVPRTCTDELEAAEVILEAICEGRVPRAQLADQAAQAVQRFDAACVCARKIKMGRRYDLRTLRAALGKTQADVAHAAGMEEGDVSRLEAHEDVKLSTLERYVSAFGGEVAVIVGGRRYRIDRR